MDAKFNFDDNAACVVAFYFVEVAGAAYRHCMRVCECGCVGAWICVETWGGYNRL
jgi:hypothetical protein